MILHVHHLAILTLLRTRYVPTYSQPLRTTFPPPPPSSYTHQVLELQKLTLKLALIDCHPLLALPEAAEELSKSMQADLVG